MARYLATAADSKKAEEIQVFDVSNIADIAQYYVICTANSERQAKAISKEIESVGLDLGIKAKNLEGLTQAQWVLIDYIDVVVHVFDRESRDFYRLERLFKDADELDWLELNKAVG